MPSDQDQMQELFLRMMTNYLSVIDDLKGYRAPTVSTRDASGDCADPCYPDLSKTWVQSIETMALLHQAYARSVAKGLQTVLWPMACRPPSDCKPRRETDDVVALLDAQGKGQGAFYVHNDRRDRVDVSFSVSPFTSGDKTVQPHVRFDPPRTSLPTEVRERIKITIDDAANELDPEKVYEATLDVRMDATCVQQLRVVVRRAPPGRAGGDDSESSRPESAGQG